MHLKRMPRIVMDKNFQAADRFGLRGERHRPPRGFESVVPVLSSQYSGQPVRITATLELDRWTKRMNAPRAIRCNMSDIGPRRGQPAIRGCLKGGVRIPVYADPRQVGFRAIDSAGELARPGIPPHASGICPVFAACRDPPLFP